MHPVLGSAQEKLFRNPSASHMLLKSRSLMFPALSCYASNSSDKAAHGVIPKITRCHNNTPSSISFERKTRGAFLYHDKRFIFPSKKLLKISSKKSDASIGVD